MGKRALKLLGGEARWQEKFFWVSHHQAQVVEEQGSETVSGTTWSIPLAMGTVTPGVNGLFKNTHEVGDFICFLGLYVS